MYELCTGKLEALLLAFSLASARSLASLAACSAASFFSIADLAAALRADSSAIFLALASAAMAWVSACCVRDAVCT
ncbi:hypothetical protein M2160_003086 [Streptomyces sp. SAI-117]|nr:hypothetical protein [Streptomyces sp. SAI-117]